MEEQTSSDRLLISQMGRSTIVVIPAVVTLLATIMSITVLTVERVRLTLDDVMPLLAVLVAAPRVPFVWRVLPLALFAGGFWLGA